MAKYVVETGYSPVEGHEWEIISLEWYPATPDERAEANTSYAHYDTEQEAARAFLRDVRDNPSASYPGDSYERAVQVSSI